MFDIRDYIVEEKTKYRSRLNRLTKDPESFFEFGFDKADYNNYLNHFTAKAAQESIGLNKSFTPNLSAMDDLIDNRDVYIEKYGKAGYNSLYSARLSQAKGDIENINKAMKWKGTKFTSDVLNSPWIKDQFVYEDTPEERLAQTLGYAPSSFDQTAAKQIISYANQLRKQDPAYVELGYLKPASEVVAGNRRIAQQEVQDALDYINKYNAQEQSKENTSGNLSERGYSSTHAGEGQGYATGDLSDRGYSSTHSGEGQGYATGDLSDRGYSSTQGGQGQLPHRSYEENMEIIKEAIQNPEFYDYYAYAGNPLGPFIENMGDPSPETAVKIAEDLIDIRYNKLGIAQRALEVAANPTDNKGSDMYYIAYGKRPSGSEYMQKVDELGIISTGVGNTDKRVGSDRIFADMYKEQVEAFISNLSGTEIGGYVEDISRYITYIDLGIAGNNVDSYIDIYKDVYGETPEIKDTKVLSDRLKTEGKKVAVYGSLPDNAKAIVDKVITLNEKGKKEGYGFDLTNEIDQLNYDIKQIVGEDLDELFGSRYDIVFTLSDKDREFLDKALRIVVSADLSNYTQNAIVGQGSTAWLQTPLGMLGRGGSDWISGFRNGILSLSQIGDIFTDDNKIERSKNYLNEQSRLTNEMFAQMLASTPDYAPWTSTLQNIGSTVVTTGLDVLTGRILGSAFSAFKGPTMLSNPAIKPTIINRIASTPSAKILLFRTYGDNTVKYKDAGDLAPFYIVADTIINTWIESFGGAYSSNSAFAQGIKNAPEGFFKAWSKDIFEESLENVAQAGATDIIESVAYGKGTSFAEQYGSVESAITTEIALILTTGIFGIGGLKSNKADAARQAYEQGNFKEAAELTIKAIEEQHKKGAVTGEDAMTFDLIKNKLTLYVSPEGQVSPINPDDLLTLPPATGEAENIQQDQTIENNEGNMLQSTNKNQIKLTEPSLPKGGKPKGSYAKPDVKKPKPIQRQNESADLLAQGGYNIEMLPDTIGGNGYGITPKSNPDYLIEGEVFDCYAPDTDNVRNIWSYIEDKTKRQAQRVILNLDDYPGSIDALYKQFTEYKINTLSELFIIKDGQIVRLIP